MSRKENILNDNKMQKHFEQFLTFCHQGQLKNNESNFKVRKISLRFTFFSPQANWGQKKTPRTSNAENIFYWLLSDFANSLPLRHCCWHCLGYRTQSTRRG